MIGDEVVPAVSAVSAGEVAERRGVRAGWAWRVTAVGVGVGAVVGWLAAYWVNEPWWDLVVYRWLGLDPGSRLGSGVHFFFFDTVKIALLLVGIIFVVTVARSYMSVERTRALLGGQREGVGNVMAAGLGVVTPFCSCSAVPAFIGFVAAGVPIGVTLSFLIASPLVNEVAIALLLGMFGPGIAGLYVGAGLVIAVVAGWVLGRLGVQRWVEPFVFQTRLGGQVIDSTAGLTFAQRVQMGREEVRSILGRIWPYLLVGIGLGAVIHGWAPQDFFARYAGAGNPLGVLVAVVVGVPLQRRRGDAAGAGPARQGPADGHAAGVHDERGRVEPAGADPAAPRPQTPAAGGLRGRHRRRHRRRRIPVQRHPRLTSEENPMLIKVLGPGCANCQALERVTRQAVEALGVQATIEKVTDYPAIAGYGVMSIPALVVDEQVVLAGRVPSLGQLRDQLAPLAS